MKIDKYITNEERIKQKRKEASCIRKLRRTGTIMQPGDKEGMQRTLRTHQERAQIIAEYDGAKLVEWREFLDAWERLWRGAGYLPRNESEALNNIQREINFAKKEFSALSDEMESLRRPV